jgi:hypothetical protein
MVVARGGMREVAIWRESNLKKDSLFKLISLLQHMMALPGHSEVHENSPQS